MSGKQLVSVLFLSLVLCVMAVAAGSQLTGVDVAPQGNDTIVTIHASGTFTHTEYRPTDNLLMVDMAGVSAADLDGKNESVQQPGVTSYRVLGFKGANGADVARVELVVTPSAVVKFSDTEGGVQIRVLGKAPASASQVILTGPETPLKNTSIAANGTGSADSQTTLHQLAKLQAPVTVRTVSVAQGGDGTEININGTGPMQADAMKLDNPDRLVIDVPNATWAKAPKQIAVKASDVKDVRLALYQVNPPVTRVVVDLTEARDYELVPQGNSIRVKLRAPGAAASSAAAEAQSTPQPETTASVAPLQPRAFDTTPAASTNSNQAAKATPATATASANPPSTMPSANPVEAAPANPAETQTELKPAETTVAPTSQASAPNSSPKVAEKLPPVAAPPAAPPSSAAAKPAQDLVVVQPNFQPKAEPAKKQEPKLTASAAPAPVVRAAEAASKFSPEPVALVASVQHDSNMQTAAMPQGAPSQAPAQPTVSVKPKYTGEPISVNLKDVDLKDFFRLIHEISGLNVVLDPNVHGSLTLVLDDVPWDQALDIVLQNNGLERELDGNVLRIATVDTLKREADARRAQIEARSLADPKITVTRFLSYAHAKDVMPIVRKFLSQRGEIMADERTNGLIMQDIPSVFSAIDQLLSQLDRKTPEVEIEARVVAATRSFARDIGTQLGFGWGSNNGSALGGASSVGTSPVSVTYPPPGPPYITIPGFPPTGGQPAALQIPLFTNLPAVGPTSGLTFVHTGGNYRVDAILTMAESKGLVKILARPRVVTQNNIQAVVKQGVKIPIVTASQLGGPSTTTYIDAILRLQVTPQITVENTIFMNIDVENTSADFGHTDNLGNPSLLTEQATTQVLVTDGGTVVIGGVIQTNNSVNTLQVPLLGDLPVLGNLFKRHTVQTQTQELIFFITPRIIQT